VTTTAFLWQADGPEQGARGVCGDRRKARRAAADLLRSGQASSAVVEEGGGNEFLMALDIRFAAIGKAGQAHAAALAHKLLAAGMQTREGERNLEAILRGSGRARRRLIRVRGMSDPLAGGMTVTGAPKSLNVRAATSNPLPVSRTVRTSARTRPCRSMLTVPLNLIPASRLPLNAYCVPVHPGPEAGPTTVTLPAFLISASICCGVAVVKPMLSR